MPTAWTPRFNAKALAAFLAGLLHVLIAATWAAATSPNPGLRYFYPAPEAPVVHMEADIVVYGGTSGGVVAAVQAARMGRSVVLVVFGRHVGGMTAGGLTSTDGVDSAVQGGITREVFRVTGRSGFPASKAEAAFEAFLDDPDPATDTDRAIPVYYEQRLQRVEKEGARIVALHMENGSEFRGRMFIDCTYEGDLMAMAGVPFAYGRDAVETFGESKAGKKRPVLLRGVDAFREQGNPDSGLIPNVMEEATGVVGSADLHVQAYNFRMHTVLTEDPSTRQPLFQPANYDAGMFELLYRFHRAGRSTHMSVGNDINNHEMFDRGCSTDHIGGNRWPDGKGGWTAWAIADYATRERIFQHHVAWQLGMLWYLHRDERYRAMATDPSLPPKTRESITRLLQQVDRLGFPLDQYPETGGWPHELYVREARRMRSNFVHTQVHVDRLERVEDSVGLANYRADSHHVRRFAGADGRVRVEGDTGGAPAPAWAISYRALVPPVGVCENLLVTWAISASQVAFCSTRMEPCHMVLSQSAATAAVLSLEHSVPVQHLPYEVLRARLLADQQILTPQDRADQR